MEYVSTLSLTMVFWFNEFSQAINLPLKCFTELVDFSNLVVVRSDRFFVVTAKKDHMFCFLVTRKYPFTLSLCLIKFVLDNDFLIINNFER